MRNDVLQEADYAAARFGLLLVLGRRRRIERRPIDHHAGARLDQIGDYKADDQGNGRQHLEIHQGLDSDTPDLLEVAHVRYADHDREKNDRADDHLDERDECIAERLHRCPESGIEVAEQDAGDDSDQHLHVERFPPATTHSTALPGSATSVTQKKKPRAFPPGVSFNA